MKDKKAGMTAPAGKRRGHSSSSHLRTLPLLVVNLVGGKWPAAAPAALERKERALRRKDETPVAAANSAGMSRGEALRREDEMSAAAANLVRASR
jgi:hypothetical protein